MPHNLASLPASSLSQAECLDRARPTSPRSVASSRLQKALLAKRVQGGSLGHEPSRVQSGKRTKPADAPSFPKRSQAEVGGRDASWFTTTLPGSGLRCGCSESV